MSKVEFMSKLESLLKVEKEDKDSILEEYESYFVEAVSDGASEEEVVRILETPEEIAATANGDLGTNRSEDVRDYLESQIEFAKRGIENTVDMLDVNRIIDKTNDVISKAVQTVQKQNIIEKINTKIENAVDKLKTMDFSGMVGDSEDFKGSKAEEIEVHKDTLTININDDNNSFISVSVEEGNDENKVVFKSIPNTIKSNITIDENGEIIDYSIPKSSIKYAGRKKLRITVPSVIKSLTIVTDCPLSIKNMELTNLTTHVGNSSLNLTEIETKNLDVNLKNGPISVKEIDTEKISIKSGSGPVIIREINSKNIILDLGHGSISIKEVQSNDLLATIGSGLVTIQEIIGKNHIYNLGAGAKTIKDLDIRNLTVTSQGGLITMKNIDAEVLDGDISGTLKTLSNIDAKTINLKK
ncbi:DUF1700 domain-containing protein [Mycoplasmatota bacterium zrk1]